VFEVLEILGTDQRTTPLEGALNGTVRLPEEPPRLAQAWLYKEVAGWRPKSSSYFHTLTDLSPDARAQYLAEHEINGETRREVEALLAFDSGASAFLAGEVSIAAGRALPQLEPKGWRCGPYRPSVE
jgi:hypothetical protein